MESSHWARAALDAVEQERAESARRYVVPRGYDAALGLSVGLLVLAVSLGAGGVGVERWAWLVAVALALLGWQLRRFVAANGAWVSGFIEGPTRWVTASAFAVEAAGFAVAILAATQQQWLLVVLVAAVTGGLFAWTSRRWSEVHRRGLTR